MASVLGGLVFRVTVRLRFFKKQTLKRSRVRFLGFGFLFFVGAVLEAAQKKTECSFKKPQHRFKTPCIFLA